VAQSSDGHWDLQAQPFLKCLIYGLVIYLVWLDIVSAEVLGQFSGHWEHEWDSEHALETSHIRYMDSPSSVPIRYRTHATV
jgi:hypothetical protein